MREVCRTHVLKEKLTHYKLECVASYKNLCYVGTADGLIIVYSINLKPDGSYETSGSQISAMSKLNPKYDKKCISQLMVVAELNLLLALCNGTIIHCTLDGDAKPFSEVPSLDNCVQFALKKDKKQFLMAVATAKKGLVIMRWKVSDVNSNFFRVPELSALASLPEVPKTINWSGKMVVLGFGMKREYIMMDVSQVNAPAFALCETGTGKNVTPMVCQLDPMREFMVIHNDVGIRCNLDGKPVSTFGISWHASFPMYFCYVHPFLFSVHDGKSVEIHIPHVDQNSYTFCQHLNIKYIQKLSGGGYSNFDETKPTAASGTPGTTEWEFRRDLLIGISSVNSIHLLEIIPIAQQVQLLFNSGKFEEALQMIRLCPTEVHTEVVAELYLKYGLDFFDKGNYAEAIKQFREANVDPRWIISLVPHMLPSYMEDAKSFSITERVASLLRKSQLSTSTQTWSDAMTALVSFLRPLRRPFPADGRVNIRDDASMIAIAIDTALLRALVETRREKEVIELLKAPNWCYLEDSQALLKSKGEWVSLVTLWRSKHEFQKSLKLLERLGTTGTPDAVADAVVDMRNSQLFPFLERCLDSDTLQDMNTQTEIRDRISGLLQPDDNKEQLITQCIAVFTTINFIKDLDGNERHQRDLIQEFSPWVLTNIPSTISLEMFLDAENPMPHQNTVQLLDTLPNEGQVTALDLCTDYLQRIGIKVEDPSLHNKRILLFLEQIHREHSAPGSTRIPSIFQEKLRRFLESSQFYDPQIAVDAIQRSKESKVLYSELASVYRRMGKHDEALKRILDASNNFEEALKYCEKVEADGGDAFSELLIILLPDSGPARPDDALALIERGRVNPMIAIQRLPDTTKLANVSDFMKRSIRSVKATLRDTSVHTNIMKTLDRSSKEQLTIQAQRRVTINANTVCASCGKKIRDTVFAFYPNGMVVHQACLEDEHICPVTKRDFNVPAAVDLLA